MSLPGVAKPSDLPLIHELLAKCGLPHEDLTPVHLPHFLVIRLDSLLPEFDPEKSKTQLLGVIGLEACGQHGLLRSLAVAPAFHDGALDGVLVGHLEAVARQAGIRRLFLLTNRADDRFKHWDYQIIDRAAVPEQVRQTTEFQSLGHSDAICWTKIL